MTQKESSTDWTHFPHGADVGIRGSGPSLGAAFAAADLAMTAASVDPDTIRPKTAITILCSGEDDEDLLYAWLNALVLEMATRAMVFGRFEVQIENGALQATAWGERVSPERHHPAVEIKGATYTALAVRHEDGQWVAQCVVDV